MPVPEPNQPSAAAESKSQGDSVVSEEWGLYTGAEIDKALISKAAREWYDKGNQPMPREFFDKIPDNQKGILLGRVVIEHNAIRDAERHKEDAEALKTKNPNPNEEEDEEEEAEDEGDEKLSKEQLCDRFWQHFRAKAHPFVNRSEVVTGQEGGPLIARLLLHNKVLTMTVEDDEDIKFMVDNFFNEWQKITKVKTWLVFAYVFLVLSACGCGNSHRGARTEFRGTWCRQMVARMLEAPSQQRE